MGDISFMANSDYDYGLTHSHQLLQVMANVIGSIEGWIVEYKKLTKDEHLFITGLQFQPKSEPGESNIENRRDIIYRHYISQLAKKYNTSSIFSSNSSSSSVKAEFNPPIKI